MNVNISSHISKFIYSQQTEYSEIQKKSINLGKRLVKKLGLERSVDTLSRWMVHSIAEQVVIVKSAKGKQKMEAKKRCLEMFSELQKHQASSSHRKHQIDDLAPVISILNKIDVS